MGHYYKLVAAVTGWLTLVVALILCQFLSIHATNQETKMDKTSLEGYVNLQAKDVVAKMGLEKAKWSWTHEPPGILRGATYSLGEKTYVKIYIGRGERLYRKFDEKCEWDYKAFLDCKVGGIQYRGGETQLPEDQAVAREPGLREYAQTRPRLFW